MPRTERKEFEGFTISLIQGDITEQNVDAIANAANSALAGGGGVDGAIHRAGGSEIKEATSKIGGCPTGGAVATTAGKLNAEYVFHAVGPVYRGGENNEAGLLASAYKSCLDLASEHELESIAFPSISTGVYGYPLEEASRIALNTVISFCENSDLPTDIRFVLFDEETFDTYAETLKSAGE